MLEHLRFRPTCDLCGEIAGQRRIVHVPNCADGCDGVHFACNQCIRNQGIDPATCAHVPVANTEGQRYA